MTNANPEGANEPFSVVVESEGTEWQEFTYAAVKPDADGIPTAIAADSEYVFLTEEQSKAMWDRRFQVIRSEKAPAVGSFAIMFAEQPGGPETLVLSVNTASHRELIEQQVRAGE